MPPCSTDTVASLYSRNAGIRALAIAYDIDMKLQGMSAVTQILSLERGTLMCITTKGVCIADISDVKPRLGEAA